MILVLAILNVALKKKLLYKLLLKKEGGKKRSEFTWEIQGVDKKLL